MPSAASNLSGLEFFIAPWSHSTFLTKLRVIAESISFSSIYVNQLSFKMKNKKLKTNLDLFYETTGASLVKGTTLKRLQKCRFICVFLKQVHVQNSQGLTPRRGAA